MATRKLELNQEQFDWMRSNVEKIYKYAKSHPYSMKGADSLESLLEALESVDKGAVPVTIDVEGEALNVVRNIVKQSLKALEEKIIPGYQRRMNGPLKVKKYQNYIDKATKTLDTVRGLNEQLK